MAILGHTSTDGGQTMGDQVSPVSAGLRARRWAANPVTAIPSLIGLVVILGLINIGGRSFWDDEAISSLASRLSWSELAVFTTERDPHTGIWHVLMHVWIDIGGTSEAWARVLSLTFAVATVVPLWFVIRQLFSSQIATLASFAVVSNATFVVFAQDARPQTLALFLTTCGVFAFVRAVQGDSQRSWVVWGVLVAFAAYAHPFTFGVAIGCVASLFALPRVMVRIKAVFVGALTSAAVMSPLIALLLADRTNGNLSWIEPLSLQRIAAGTHLVTGHLPWLLGLAVAALVVLYSVQAIRYSLTDGRSIDAWKRWLVVAWTFAVPLLLTMASFVEPIFEPRYLFPALPGVAIATVLAIRELSNARVSRLAAAVLCVAGLLSVAMSYDSWTRSEWRDAVTYVAQNARTGDGVVVGGHRAAFEYYILQRPPEVRQALIPLSPTRQWGSEIVPKEDLLRDRDPQQMVNAFASVERVWALDVWYDEKKPVMSQKLQDRFGQARVFEFDPNVTVRLYG